MKFIENFGIKSTLIQEQVILVEIPEKIDFSLSMYKELQGVHFNLAGSRPYHIIMKVGFFVNFEEELWEFSTKSEGLQNRLSLSIICDTLGTRLLAQKFEALYMDRKPIRIVKSISEVLNSEHSTSITKSTITDQNYSIKS